MAKATAAKPKDDDKKSTTAATAATEGAGPVATDKPAPTAQSSAPAAGDTPAAPVEPARLPGVVVTGLQLCEALTFLAPDGSREQLGESLILELMEPAGRPAGLYAYHVESSEEGSILLTGEAVELALSAQRVEEEAPKAVAPAPRIEGLSQAAADVLAERLRQVEQKGYSVEHDGGYQNGELPMAAACYAVFGAGGQMARSVFNWPFKTEAFRPHDPRRAMVKAAALLLSAIEAGDATGWDDSAMK